MSKHGNLVKCMYGVIYSVLYNTLHDVSLIIHHLLPLKPVPNPIPRRPTTTRPLVS